MANTWTPSPHVSRAQALTAMRAGAASARASKPMTSNPYATINTPAGDLLADTWTTGYLAAGGTAARPARH